MKRILIYILPLVTLAACKESPIIEENPDACSITATVKDLTGLDGCNFVFELTDGTKLIPERRTYIQAPSAEADPVYYYQFKDGAKVQIGFQDSQALSACMAGRMIFITCIKNLPATEQ